MPDTIATAHTRSLGSEVLVCHEAGDSPFPDDLHAPCVDCGRALSFRPYMPAEEPKLCVSCFALRKSLRAAN